MKRVKGLRKRGILWSMKERLEDLDYAADICLLAHRFCDMKEELKIAWNTTTSSDYMTPKYSPQKLATQIALSGRPLK
jgi:hypothetical protein